MISDGLKRSPAPVQERPAAAVVRSSASLRTRLAVFVAIAIALVISVSTWFENRLFERTIESELLDSTRVTALAVADDLELRSGQPSVNELREILEDFIEAIPALRTMSFVRAEPGGGAELYASTAVSERPEIVDLARIAIKRDAEVWGPETGMLRTLAVPAVHDGQVVGAVTATVSLASREQFRHGGRAIAAATTAGAVVILIVLIELVVRRLVHRPLGSILATMRMAAAGDLSARTEVMRRDEMGKVASGLNHMLEQMEDLNTGLQQRVQQATAELRARNRELVETYQQMFRLRQDLSRAEQMAAVGQTASNVAHQIGTPLNLVSGHIQVIMQEEGPGSPVARRLQIAAEQIRKVSDAVRGILDRARRPPTRERTDVTALVTRMCGLVQPAAAIQSVQLDLRVQAGVPAVDVDTVQLELALLNLISNGLDAMPAGGLLTVSVEPSAEGVRIAVGDTGPGIPPDLLGRIFEPWVTTKGEGQGTGLGLSITREVIAEHGGTITVRSESGAGTVFTVTLPAAPAVADAPGVSEHAEHPDS